MKARAEQFNALEQSTHDSFLVRVAAYLRQNLPRQVGHLEQHELLARVSEIERIAIGYGVKSERGIAKWAFMSFAAGMDFHKNPVIEAHLRRPDIDPNEKIDFLMRALAFRLRAAEREAH